jgi:hypothetical protein
VSRIECPQPSLIGLAEGDRQHVLPMGITECRYRSEWELRPLGMSNPLPSASHSCAIADWLSVSVRGSKNRPFQNASFASHQVAHNFAPDLKQLCLLLFFPIHERLSFESGRMGISESRELSMCF